MASVVAVRSRLWSRPLGVPGTLAVLWALALGRWGSYLGVPSRSLYITDGALLLGAACLVRAVYVQHKARQESLLPSRRVWLPSALLLWALVRFATSDFSSLALRDAAPFVYGVLMLLVVVLVTRVDVRRSSALVVGGLMAHAAWVAVSLHYAGLSDSLPLLGGKVHVLEIRSDFDGACLAVLAGVGLHALIRAREVWLRLVGLLLIGWPAWMILQFGNRASTLALLLALVVVVAVHGRWILRLPRTLLAAIAALVIVAGLVVLPHTTLFERLNGDPRFSNNSTAGTTEARQLAWTSVLAYSEAAPGRFMLGVGFGPDFVQDSGARQYFGRPGEAVRAPHNWLLFVLARLGLVGLLLFVGVLGQSVLSMRRALTASGAGVDVLVPILVASTLFLASMFGVILESPFGAVPFFWSLGLLFNPAVSPVRRRSEITSRKLLRPVERATGQHG